MNPWARTAAIAVAAAAFTYLIFGLLFGFGYTTAHWYLPVLAAALSGTVMRFLGRRRSRDVS
ncbi:hypothetical protein [Luethyella okanaganae]|uniref:DUF4175 domain-containing protein n=1 Tax=Luethyella okanaganae TaxID=69372 RepID=A0ABW1VFJ3_9MICO